VTGRGTEENMKALGEAFKSGDIERLEGVLGRANRGIQQVGDSSARTRYAVLNLGYGVQDAVQVFGTSGLAGAVKASANNLQGLGIIFEKTAGGMQGLKAALTSGEFIVMGIATAVLVAASAWEAYRKSIQEAMDVETKEKFKRLDPKGNVEQAGRAAVLEEELRRIEKLEEAEKRRKDLLLDLVRLNAQINQAGREEIDLKDKIAKTEKDLAVFARLQERRLAAGANLPPTAAEKAAIDRLQEQGGADQVRNDLARLKEDLAVVAGKKGEVGMAEKLVRDKKRTQEELDAVTKRIEELQPNEISNAIQQLKTLKSQAEALDDQINKQSALNKQKKDGFDASKKELDILLSAINKSDAMLAEIRKRTTSLGTPKGIREKPEYQLTDEEWAAARKHGFLYPTNEADRVAQQRAELERGQKAADALKAQREKVAKDIAAINEKYPMIARQEEEPGVYTAKGRARLMEQERRDAERQQKADARQAEKDRKEADRDEKIARLAARRNLQEFESDMEYRLGFLGKKRREIEQRMRIGSQPTGVAEFESSTAYEALARSRMQQSPQMDVLQTIAKEEQKATAALEDIREKLDPGRRARIAILETLE
jgi:hypothetical protein